MSLQGFDPRARLGCLIVAVGSIAALQTVPAAAVALTISIALAVGARLPLNALIYRLGIVLLALAPVVLLLPFFGGVGGGEIAAVIALKALAMTAIATTTLFGSPSPTLAWAARQFGVPRTLVRIGLLTRRFGHVLGHEMLQMRTAARCRGAELGIHPGSLKTTGTLVGTLMIRGVARAERVAQALQCRGDVGEIRLLAPPAFRWRDGALLLAVIAAAALVIVWDYRLAH